MSESEDALAVLRRVIQAMNAGEDTAVLRRMTDDVVIVDDVAPFHRSGRREAEEWLEGLSRARSHLNASIDLESAEVSEIDKRAYIVVPGQWKGRLQQEDLQVNGLATVTLVQRDGAWLIDALIWTSRD